MRTASPWMRRPGNEYRNKSGCRLGGISGNRISKAPPTYQKTKVSRSAARSLCRRNRKEAAVSVHFFVCTAIGDRAATQTKLEFDCDAGCQVPLGTFGVGLQRGLRHDQTIALAVFALRSRHRRRLPEIEVEGLRLSGGPI